MASSANHVHYGAVWPALLLRARQKVSLGSLAGPQSSAADQTHGGEINHLTVQAAAVAVAEQRQQSVQQLLCLCQLPLAVPSLDELPPRGSIGGAADGRRGPGNDRLIPLSHGPSSRPQTGRKQSAWPFLCTPIYKMHLQLERTPRGLFKMCVGDALLS